MFSVVVPAFNNALTVRRAVNSVLGQSWHDLELILVNDGSNDRTLEVIGDIQDPRFRVITTKNRGVASARNLGVSKSKYPWVCFLDADDMWGKEHLSGLADLISNYPNYRAFSLAYEKLDVHGQSLPIRRIFSGGSGRDVIVENLPFLILRKIFPFHPNSMAISRALGDQVGWFPEGLCAGEDLVFQLRLTRREPVIYRDIVTSFYFVYSAPMKKGRVFRSRDPFLFPKELVFETQDKMLPFFRRFCSWLLAGKVLRSMDKIVEECAPDVRDLFDEVAKDLFISQLFLCRVFRKR